MIHHHHNNYLVYLSVLIAMLSSYIALDLANSLAIAKGRSRWLWLTGGSLAMGVGIWSMHFVAMLAFSLPNISIAYDLPLLLLSIFVAICASALTLYIVSGEHISIRTYVIGSLTMGAAIAGMHYLGIASMRLAADIHWDLRFVVASIAIAIGASFVALLLAFKLRKDTTKKGTYFRLCGGVIMGIAIAGMHYTAMAAMSFTPNPGLVIKEDELLATNGLAVAVIIGTIIILTVALAGSIIDKTLSRRIEMTDELEDAVKSRDDFLTIASHELKTPLTSIKMQTQFIIRYLTADASMSEEQKEKCLKKLFQTDVSVNRLTRLVDDMLDISRITTGKLALQLEEFDLSEMVRDVAERLSPLMAEAKCSVQLQVVEEVIGNWDRFRLEQVLTNLLTNAAKYGAGKPILVKLRDASKEVILTVKDQGRGIAPEDHQRIFQRFERIHTTDKIKGLGIGLFIVNQIVRMHHGEISVKSELEEGSEFFITLPKHF